MTTKNKASLTYTHEYRGFKGIDRTLTDSGKGGICDIVNMRVASDGALKKREAIAHKATLMSAPRAFYAYDNESALVLLGKYFGILNTTDFTFRSVTTIATNVGKGSFFCYDGKVLLLDGSELYVCTPDGVTVAQGYAPLYGREWDPTSQGAIYEKPNLLSNHLRISYRIKSDLPSRFMFNILVKSIDAVYVDGTKISTTQFALADGGMWAGCAHSIYAGSEVTFYLTVDELFTKRSDLTCLTRASVFGTCGGRGADVSSIAFFGDASPGKIVCTHGIDREQFLNSKKGYPKSLGIYVTDDDFLTLGDGSDPVTEVCRRGSRLMVFTENEAYVLNESGDSSYAFLISAGGGCGCEGGSVSFGDSPVTVSRAGIFKWTPTRYDSDEYVAEKISTPIDGMTGSEFHQNALAFFYRKTGELWFADGASSDRRVFIYNTLLDLWYCFTGLSPDLFFEANGRLGFFSGADLFVFDSDGDKDTYGGAETPIICTLSIGSVSFGSFEFLKRLYRLSVRTDPGGSVLVTLCDASGKEYPTYPIDSSGERIGYSEVKLHTDRARYYTLTLRTGDGGAKAIYGLSLCATE